MPLMPLLLSVARSKTLWGVALTGVSLAAHGLAGMSGGEVADAVQNGSDVLAMIGLGLSAWGRLRATERLPTAPGGAGALQPKRELEPDERPWLNN